MAVENRRTAAVKHAGLRYQLEAEHGLRDQAIAFADTYLDVIVDSMVNQPRSLQTKIGPSQIGHPCDRALLHRLNQDPEPRKGAPPWKATIGTGVHSYLDDAFMKDAAGGENQGRWITEQRVTVGKIGEQTLSGSTDLFDTWTGTVADHKCVGKSRLKHYRANGPSPQYRYQAHSYGAGWVAAGHDVKMVAICFLPREGELAETFIWTEPFDPALAQAALDRANAWEDIRTKIGIEQALTLADACDDHWCSWCGTGSSFPPRRTPVRTTNDLLAPARTTAEMFAAEPDPPSPAGSQVAQALALLGLPPAQP